MLNLDLLKTEIDVSVVLDTLGVETKEKGNKIWFLCPFHSDKNIGSAYFTEKGYYTCFSCGAKGDIFDFVMEHNKSSFSEAIEFLGNLFGGIEKYGSSELASTEIKQYKRYRLTKDETTVLNIPGNINLKSLYLYDESYYKKFIFDKASELLQRYKYLLENCCRRDAPNALSVYELFKQTTAATYANLASEGKRRIAVCEEIKERFA